MTVQSLHWIYNDGGRANAGFRGTAGDCVVRAIAISTGQEYRVVYKELTRRMRGLPVGRRTPRRGVQRPIYQAYLEDLGWEWVPTMSIGSGTTMHLRRGEVPTGRIIARVSHHLAAVVDDQLHDTYDCSRGGTRAVYGYFRQTRRLRLVPGQ